MKRVNDLINRYYESTVQMTALEIEKAELMKDTSIQPTNFGFSNADNACRFLVLREEMTEIIHFQIDVRKTICVLYNDELTATLGKINLGDFHSTNANKGMSFENDVLPLVEKIILKETLEQNMAQQVKQMRKATKV